MFLKILVFLFIIVNADSQKTQPESRQPAEAIRSLSATEESPTISWNVIASIQDKQTNSSEVETPSNAILKSPDLHISRSLPIKINKTPLGANTDDNESNDRENQLFAAALKSFSRQIPEGGDTKNNFIQFVESAVRSKAPQELSTDEQRVRLLIRKLFKISPGIRKEHQNNPEVSELEMKDNHTAQNNSEQIAQKLHSRKSNEYESSETSPHSKDNFQTKYMSVPQDYYEAEYEGDERRHLKASPHSMPSTNNPKYNRNSSKNHNKFRYFEHKNLDVIPKYQSDHPPEDIETPEAMKQAQNAKYSFASDVRDEINGNVHQRQETRNGTKVTGHYTYEDGFFRRTVHYAADENGYRVVKEDVAEIGDGPSYNPNGMAKVLSNVAGKRVDYRITARDFDREFQDGYGDRRHNFDGQYGWYQ